MVETQEAYRFEMTLNRVPFTNKISNLVQRQVFDSVLKFMMDGFHIDRKGMTKEQLSDEKQVISVKGTKEFCEKCKAEVENIEKAKINEFVDRTSKIKLLPKFVRHKIMNVKYDSTVTSFTWLQSYLAALNIIIAVDVVKNETQQVHVNS